MNFKGHDGVMMSGALAVCAFRPVGLPRRQRATVSDIARRSAYRVGAVTDHHLATLAHKARQARDRDEEIGLRIRALQTEQAARRYQTARIEDHLHGILREHPQADHLYDGAFGPNRIVNTGEGYLVDAWQSLVTLANMKFHGVGTGTTAAAETDTDLVTPCTTALNPDNTRGTGSLGEASQSVFRSQGTLTFDAIVNVTEWGLFSQAALGGGVMFSRVVFTSIPSAVGGSILFTYDFDVTSPSD